MLENIWDYSVLENYVKVINTPESIALISEKVNAIICLG